MDRLRRSLHLRTVAVIGWVVLTVFVSVTAYAGAQLPCESARVFQGAAVNSFVLPYRYVGSKNPEAFQTLSRHIASLVHLELLFSMLKYGAVGATNLVTARDRQCNVDTVIGRVAIGGGPGALRRGHTLVLVWGRLFVQHDQLYLQTYVRFLRKGESRPVPETISVQLKGEGLNLRLGAALPTQSLAFPPRRISTADLAKVTSEFKKAMVVRQTPTLKDNTGRSIDFAPNRPFPYYVSKTVQNNEGRWMWIQPMTGGPAGWVLASSFDKPNTWSLQRWMPELYFIDAIHGFMRLRARVETSMTPSSEERVKTWMDADIARFEAAIPAEDASSVYGVARAMQGFATWQLRGWKGRASAAHLFEEVGRRMPDNAAALNLSAITRPLGTDRQLDGKAIQRLDHGLIGALALDPKDTFVLGNLDRLYSALRRQYQPVMPTGLDRRLAIIRAARKRVLNTE